VNLWKSQNAFYELLSTVYPAIRSRADAGDQDSARWAELFEVLGEQLSVVVS
jgi:hypothetical protein